MQFFDSRSLKSSAPSARAGLLWVRPERRRRGSVGAWFTHPQLSAHHRPACSTPCPCQWQRACRSHPALGTIDAGVLIPSRSGHAIKPNPGTCQFTAKVLIPSRSGHAIKPTMPATCQRRSRLNPFSIRACNQTAKKLGKPFSFRLNPFSIRACNQTNTFEGCRSFEVLIPSRSGHAIKRHLAGTAMGTCKS